MPKKSAAKKTTKTVKQKVSVSTPLHKRHFLVHEQHAFHNDHPNAQMLLTVFIGAAVILMVLYLSKYGLSRMAY